MHARPISGRPIAGRFGLHRLRHVPLPIAVLVFALIACVLLVCLDGWRTFQSREAAIAGDYADTTNLARSLAQHAHDTAKFADILLVHIRDNLEGGGWDQKQIALLQRAALADIENLPPVHGFFVFDATGKWVVNSLPDPAAGLTANNEAFFKYHQTHADRGVVVGDLLPCRFRTDCSFVFPVSRRIDAPDGSFAGVVMATVAVDYLKNFYQTFAAGERGVIALLQTNGKVVIRAAAIEVAPGTDTSRGQLFQTLLPQSPVGIFREASPIDGITRLASYRKVDQLPLLVVVAHAEADVLAGWRRDAMLHLGISIGVATAIAILGVRLARQIRNRQQAERRYQILADNSSDAIVCLGLDGRRLYLSPAYADLTGWSAEESVGMTMGSTVHPDDREGLFQHFDMLKRRQAGEVTLEFRYVRKDGSTPWVEARARYVEAEDGQPAQIVANLRDITVRKAADKRIHALNLELEKLAMTDGLTGLSNRRRFDEALAEEWGRAARSGQALSLLMIDIDRFKLYNDHYGHQQGDEALRIAASVLRGFCRRPGDVAARYGGEEMALLLPAADIEGAAGRAEAVRAAIEALGLEHAGNPALPVLTASLGVATALPSLDGPEAAPASLTAAADAALYEAKRTGRNCVIRAPSANWDLARLIDVPAMEEKRREAIMP